MFGITVAGIEHRGDPALSPVAGAVQQRTFGNDHNFAGLCEMQSNRQAGQSATDNDDIEFHD